MWVLMLALAALVALLILRRRAEVVRFERGGEGMKGYYTYKVYK